MSSRTHSCRHRSNDPISFEEQTFPYYGGLSGQFLRFQKERDGTINTVILGKAPTMSAIGTSKPNPLNTQFEQDFNKIQLAAARLVAIQELAKRKGSFSDADNKVYADSLNELGQAAQSLAKLQQTGQIKDFGMLLQPEIMNPGKLPFTSIDQASVTKVEPQKLDEVTEQQLTEDDLLPPNPEDPYEDVSDSVAVAVPKKDASVAEAKPVGE